MRPILTRYLLPLRSRAALLFVIMLVDISLDLVNPQLQRAFIDGAVGGVPAGDLVRLAAIFVGIAFVLQGLYVSAGLVSAELAQTATNRMREDLLEHVLSLDLAFHGRHTPGELIERIDGDVATLSNFLSRFLLELVGSTFLVVGVLFMLFRVDARIGGTMAAFVVLAIAIMRGVLHLAVPHWAAAREASAQLFGFLEERLSGTEDLRANGGVPYTLRRFFALSREIWRRNLRASLLGSATGGTSVLLLFIAMSISLAWAVVLVQAGTITIGTGWLLFSYSLQLDGPLSGIARQLGDLQQAGASITRIRALLDERSTLVEPPPERATALPPGALTVDLVGVDFEYGDTGDTGDTGDAGDTGAAGAAVDTAGGVGERDEDGDRADAGDDDAAATKPPATLSDVTLHVPAGGTLGLLGPSGSGKTTLSRLLLRLLDPTAGTVRLGGVDVRDVPLDDLRRRVAIVTQDVQLFNASLRDNLTLFDPTISDDAIRAALATLGLRAWVDALPDGLATVLAPGGGVSAGEAQLLAFARVFLGDPGLVVLDEASSRLDPATEARLTDAMTRLAAGRTVIVIAHRLATVQRLDAVCLLAGGRVIEHGPRAALAADGTSRYARLLAAGLEDLDTVLDADGAAGR
ncbi:MAG: ABC transporter ATP-binding protein [Ardenticatenales bacterium]